MKDTLFQRACRLPIAQHFSQVTLVSFARFACRRIAQQHNAFNKRTVQRLSEVIYCRTSRTIFSLPCSSALTTQ